MCNLDKYNLQYLSTKVGKVYYDKKEFDKYIWTTTFSHLDKYILQIVQIQFAISEHKGRKSVL